MFPGFSSGVAERLFHGTELWLNWGDAHLTVHDTVSDLNLKLDLRILHDRTRQRYNLETYVGVFEAAPQNFITKSHSEESLLSSKDVADT